MTETNDAPEAKPAFAIETKTCFETYASPEDRAAIRELAARYIDFLTATGLKPAAYLADIAAGAPAEGQRQVA